MNRFVNSSVRRLGKIKYAQGVRARFDILVYALLNSLPRTIRKQFHAMRTTISRLNPTFDGMTLYVNGVKYVLIDRESFHIADPEYEAWIWGYLKPNKADVFLDVGAHIGKYALQVAKVVGDEGLVVAVEAMPKNYNALMQGLELNHFRNVVALNIAAWNANCRLRLFRSNISGQHGVKDNKGLGYIKVPAKKLDDILESLNINRVDWIKIDVEGAEYEVLHGLENTLKRNSPKVIVEIRNKNLRKAFGFMKKLNYQMSQISKYNHEFNYYFCQKRAVPKK